MVRFASAVLIAALAATPALAADGAQLFASTCKICHQGPSTPLAPSLAGVAGKARASRTDFQYSAALKAKGGVWTDADLDKWLTKPSAFVPGTKMVVSVPDPANRAAIIAYLHTLK
jgi:cytochrome c